MPKRIKSYSLNIIIFIVKKFNQNNENLANEFEFLIKTIIKLKLKLFAIILLILIKKYHLICI